MNETTLQHWGIKGMKWGVRRYQNKDGTLTALGRKREKEMSDKLKSTKKENEALKKENEALRKSIQASKPKSISEMSDDELRQKINRLQMEKQYSEVYKQLYPTAPKQESAGAKFAKKMFSESVVPALSTVGKSFIEKSLKKALGLEDKPDPNKQLELASKKLDYASKQLDYESKKLDLNNKKNPKVDELADKVKSAENEFKLAEWKDKLSKLGKDDKPVDNLADEVKRLENEWKKKDWEFKLSNFGKDDTPVADVVKQLTSMSKEDRDNLAEAARIQENINKLKKGT